MINIKTFFNKRFFIQFIWGVLWGFLGLIFYWITGIWSYGVDGAQGTISDLFLALIQPPFILFFGIFLIGIVYAIIRCPSGKANGDPGLAGGLNKGENVKK